LFKTIPVYTLNTKCLDFKGKFIIIYVMKSLKIHKEWQVWFNAMDNDEKALMLDNIMRYMNNEELIFTTSATRMAWNIMQSTFENQRHASQNRSNNMRGVGQRNAQQRPALEDNIEHTPGVRPALQDIKEPTTGDTGFSSQPVAGTGPKSWQHILDNLGKTKQDDDWVVSDSNDDW